MKFRYFVYTIDKREENANAICVNDFRKEDSEILERAKIFYDVYVGLGFYYVELIKKRVDTTVESERTEELLATNEFNDYTPDVSELSVSELSLFL